MHSEVYHGVISVKMRQKYRAKLWKLLLTNPEINIYFQYKLSDLVDCLHAGKISLDQGHSKPVVPNLGSTERFRRVHERHTKVWISQLFVWRICRAPLKRWLVINDLWLWFVLRACCWTWVARPHLWSSSVLCSNVFHVKLRSHNCLLSFRLDMFKFNLLKPSEICFVWIGLFVTVWKVFLCPLTSSCLTCAT